MQGKCCCGCCSLRAGATFALTFAAIESICGLAINTEFLLLISEYKVFNLSRLVIDFAKVDDFDVFHGIVLAAIGLNAFWFVFCIIAVTGNITQSHGRLTPWVLLTYLITLFYFGLTIYFAIKFQSSYSEQALFYEHGIPTKTLTYLTLLCIYSGGGLTILLNFYFAHVVELRGKEIDHDYSDLMMYIFSHMSRCTHVNGEAQQNLLPEAPPVYTAECPPYLSGEIYHREGSSGSNGSNWSLSCEALKTMSTGEPNTAYAVNNDRRNISTRGNFVGVLSRNNTSSYQPLNANTDSSVLPY